MSSEACIDFPPHLSSNLWFYATNVITTPIILGIGVFGNLLCLIVFNIAQIRKSSPAFAYIIGLVVVDIISLSLVVPRYLRDSEALPPDLLYSRMVGYIMVAEHGLSAICTHTATWYIVMANIVFVARMNSTRLKPSWTKVSISRILAFVLFLAATILNFPKFFSYSVNEVLGHCFLQMNLWDLKSTALGESLLYTSLYPWIIISATFAAPFLTLTIVCMALPVKMGFNSFCTKKVVLQNANTDEARKLHLGKSLFILAIMLIILEVPHNVAYLFVTLYRERATNSSGFYEFLLLSEVLRRLRTSITFFVFCLFYGDFRKCLRRVFCCSGDEHYEPCTCCMPNLSKLHGKEEKVHILDREVKSTLTKANVKPVNGYYSLNRPTRRYTGPSVRNGMPRRAHSVNSLNRTHVRRDMIVPYYNSNSLSRVHTRPQHAMMNGGSQVDVHYVHSLRRERRKSGDSSRWV